MTILFLLIMQDKTDDAKQSHADESSGHACSLDISVAEHLNLTTPISYGRLRINVEEPKWYHRSGNHSETKELGVYLPSLHRLTEIDGALVAGEDETCVSHTTIKIPKLSKAPIDASNIVFGVATNLDRLEGSLKAFAHWAGNTATSILSLVEHDSGDAGQLARVLRDAKDLGIDLNIARQNLTEESSEGDRYFALVKHLSEQRHSDPPQWAALIDDDTFFPSIQAVLQQLDGYDASKPQYIGGLTEDLHQMQNFGYMAYGGGGVFMSMPLLSQVNEHFEECNATGIEGGDKRLAECIYAHTTTKMSWESGLHQTDLHGDPSGFYEADRAQPLSIHHWKSWNEVDVVGLSTVASICGQSCLLQRYQFADGWHLVNGFSIFKYSDGYLADDIDMEETWWDSGDYAHSLAPLRPKDYGKVSYRLEKSVVDGKRVMQYYVRRDEGGNGVIEVVWQRR